MTRKGLIIAALIFSVIFSQAQLSKGYQLLTDESWYNAAKAFSDSKEDEAVFYKGFCEIKMDQADEAIKTFQSLGDKPYGKIGSGWIELNKGNKTKAYELFQSAANETKNKNAQVLAAIGQSIAFSKATNKEDAYDWAKKAVELAKNNATIRMICGDIYLANQDGGAAITNYEYAQQFDPNNATPIAKVGKVYFNSRTYDLSKENLQKALDKSPNNILALNYMAQIFYKYKSYDSAKMYQQKLMDVGGKNPEDEAMMANILFQSKDYDGAIIKISEIIKGDNKYNYLNRLIGYSYFETGKAPEAVEYLNKFLATQPKEKIIPSDYEYLGNALLKSGGDQAQALNAFKSAYDQKPNDIESIKKIAATLKTNKLYDEAIDYYTKATKLPEATAQEFFELAGVYFAKKDYTNADAMYSKSIELAPNSAGAYYQRATSRMYADPDQKTISAKSDYSKFLELTTDKVDKYKKQIVKANIYLAKDAIVNLNDKAAGKSYLDAALALDATNVEATSLLEHVK